MIVKGKGVGCMWYGVGNTGLPNPAGAFIEVHNDGTATLLAGCADIGQGSDTVLAQIAAETLGITYDKVYIRSADTGATPEGGASSASRQTYISGNATYFAALEAKENIVAVAAEMLECEAEDVILSENTAYNINDSDNKIDYKEVMLGLKARGLLALGKGQFNPNASALGENMQGIPYATYAFATHIAEVEVNTETGELSVLKLVAAHDVGTAIHKQNVEAQIEGGALMGMGFALSEKVELNNGYIKNPDFNNYIIPSAQDMPEIYPIIVEDYSNEGPYGAKGVGEPSLIPAAPAILNAVYDAIGIRFTELPLTADVVLAAIKAKEKQA
jgi:CO/xanthine dehydrogenase Mo-binding subunit